MQTFKLIEDWNKISGTHLQGEIDISFDQLVSIFGEPNSDGDGYKVQKEWMIEFADGTVATVYDYKQGIEYNGSQYGVHYQHVRDWHIGGHDPKAAEYVKSAVRESQMLTT